MFGRLKGVAVGCAALAIASTALYAAGNYSTYPIVGGAAFCVSTVSGAGGFNTDGNVGGSGATGQGQATSGSLCAQTVPAGPTILTGSELIPADTGLPGGASPQTVTVPMASLNALPISFTTIPTNVTATLSATNLSGGVMFHSTATVTGATVTLPAAPIDGQQFALTSDQTITTLVVTATAASGQSIQKAPTVITPSTTGSYGYRFLYNAALNTWARLQ